ncbi:DedA family protein [Streptomyces iconiensis]|uniref:VTT domain-containing protein n=1 Tax=Streptomyces iconiensis TaxID=1384038 RepID=A0ABT6ZNN5_9ACTN|nr:VTT domain-containing protein [Streptomyces iconiensis]MDJ1130650.1 VTT domain-containing protein [Streptomyces iconiensis]
MPEVLGSVTGSPWIYAVIAASVLLDVFVPLLPSGVLVIAAATAAAGTTAADAADLPTAAARHAAQSDHLVEMLLLVLCAAGASLIGDMVAWRLAWRGGERFDRAVARSRKLTHAQESLGRALVRGGGVLVVLARFAPAGRSVVSLTAGAARRRARDFAPWSALAGLAWAAYSVSLGYFGGQWLGASWLGTAVSVFALFAAGGLAAYVIRREPGGGAADEVIAAVAAAGPAPAPSSGAVTFPVLPSMRAVSESGLLPVPAPPTAPNPTEAPSA